jgi:hypothetical protein
MSESGRARAEEFSWERVTAKVDAYYGFVIRRLAAQGQLPSGFAAAIPPSPRGIGALALDALVPDDLKSDGVPPEAGQPVS